MSDRIQVTGAGKTLALDLDFVIKDLKPADYNPRRLSEDAFVRLQASLKKWGIVKPVIVNADGTLVAGHQRTKALQAIGQETCAAVVLPTKVRMSDEIQFNMLHNRVEVEASEVYIPAGRIGHWELVEWDQINVVDRQAAAFRKAIGGLISSFGPWGSVVADDQGRIFLNAEYAVACYDLKVPLLVYTIPAVNAAEMLADLTGEYGVYDWTNIDAPVYNQHGIQPQRLREKKAGKKTGTRTHMESTTWKGFVLPWLSKAHRVVDFGSGYGDYARELRKQGYLVEDYEPNRVVTGSYAIDVRAIVGMISSLEKSIRNDGLFDVVVLDSVINGTTDLIYQDAVCVMVNALCRRDGVLVLGTRTLAAQMKAENCGSSGSLKRDLNFLDDNNVEVFFQNGKWMTIRYHTEETLRELLDHYFEDVVIKNPTQGNMHAICRQPKKLDVERVRAAAELEFNMPSPPQTEGGEPYFHGRHKKLVATLVAAYEAELATTRIATADATSVLVNDVASVRKQKQSKPSKGAEAAEDSEASG